MKVTVTQYIFRNGETLPQETEIDDSCAAAYEEMQHLGWILAAMRPPRSDWVHLFIVDPNDGSIIDKETAPNGPTVQVAIETMLRRSCSPGHRIEHLAEFPACPCGHAALDHDWDLLAAPKPSQPLWSIGFKSCRICSCPEYQIVVEKPRLCAKLEGIS